MIDKDFEALSASVRLMTNDGYFERYWQLQPKIGVKKAWLQVESELPFGLRRFLSYHSFQVAKKNYANGTLTKTPHLKLPN